MCCVNDPWVMSAWTKDMGTEAKGIRMLADPRCELAQALGCTQDDTAKLGNVRSRRYSMVRSARMHGVSAVLTLVHQIVQDNVVKFLNVEKPGPTVRAACLATARLLCRSLAGIAQELGVSLVEHCLQQLKQLKQA